MLEAIMWVVQSGSSNRYFYDEGEARDYARDMIDIDYILDGEPFIHKVTLREAISELNRLSSLDHRVSFEVMP